MKRVLILDLDNTIYPVSSIASDVFDSIFELIDNELGANDQQAAAQAKHELTRRPYQQVAEEHGFSDELKTKGIELLRNLSYDKPMQWYPEYEVIRAINIDKYLVTKGFKKLQNSKFKMLGIESDFKKCIVVDPEESPLNKKDIFAQIIADNGYAVEEVLVVGDDPESEIKAAQELGIDTFLFDPANKHPHANVTYRGKDYTRIQEIIER
ncbi:HAD family hydrolase [Mucilaginibacter glaciei]|uniref:HAD family hydrolase n=1 Tax=Mucilaginibacter glaciei TaxID=2772109 RepID=A0A926NU80_9SPHI|nr:HAD family hydrolase [Mucilaginibacter glaciei]MBD1395373.1 HAD family hydrolase [Mucilaginibacter glaciei]